MQISEIIIITLFALSILANISYVLFNRQMGKYTFRWDLFRWVSSYQLFSLTPRHFKLYYRDQDNGEVTDWREISLISQRRWYQLIVFPEKLVTDNIYSYIDDLVSFTESSKDMTGVSESFHYRTILKYVARMPGARQHAERQFKIEEAGGHISEKTGHLKFISEFESECISN